MWIPILGDDSTIQKYIDSKKITTVSLKVSPSENEWIDENIYEAIIISPKDFSLDVCINDKYTYKRYTGLTTKVENNEDKSSGFFEYGDIFIPDSNYTKRHPLTSAPGSVRRIVNLFTVEKLKEVFLLQATKDLENLLALISSTASTLKG